MTLGTYFLSLWSLFAWFSPVVQDHTSPEIKALRGAGFEIQGRDPLDGTGMCGLPLFPAYLNEEVYYAELPRDNWRPGLLDKLRQFPNLLQVRAKRPLAPAEYLLLRRLLPSKVCIIVDIRSQGSDLLSSYELERRLRKWPLSKSPRKLSTHLLKQRH